MSDKVTLASITKRLRDIMSVKSSLQNETRSKDSADSDAVSFTDVRRGESRRVRPSLNAP